MPKYGSVKRQHGRIAGLDILLDKILAHTETAPVNGLLGYGYAHAFVHALRGNRRQALTELNIAIDAGVRHFWWYDFDHSLGFKSLREDPEFQALRARVAADMAEQFAKVSKKESPSFMN